MTNVRRAAVSLPKLGGAAETEVLRVTIPLLRTLEPVAVQWMVKVTTPSVGTTAQRARLKRDSATGVLLKEIANVANIANNALRLYDAIAPVFDKPGLPAQLTYVVTLEMVGALASSTGIEGYLYATYD